VLVNYLLIFIHKISGFISTFGTLTYNQPGATNSENPFFVVLFTTVNNYAGKKNYEHLF